MGPDPAILRSLIDRSPIVPYVADEHGAITYISAQITEWTGLPARRWTDDPAFWLDMIHPEDRPRVIAAAADSSMLDIEYRIRGRDGGWLWIWEREVAVAARGPRASASTSPRCTRRVPSSTPPGRSWRRSSTWLR